MRLSRLREEQGDVEQARSILARCITANPSSRLARLAYAQLLIRQNEEQNGTEILKQLRASFSDGDSNVDAQFWFARHHFLFGEREVADRYFVALSKAKGPMTSKRRPRGHVVDALGKHKVFSGRVRTVSDAYCFVRVTDLGCDVFCHHSEVPEDLWDGLSVGTNLAFELAFSFKGPVAMGVRSD